MSEFQNYQNNDSSGLNSSGSDGDANGGNSQKKSGVGTTIRAEPKLYYQLFWFVGGFLQGGYLGWKGVQLRQKLFRLKPMQQLQDTEENTDDSELKVL